MEETTNNNDTIDYESYGMNLRLFMLEQISRDDNSITRIGGYSRYLDMTQEEIDDYNW